MGIFIEVAANGPYLEYTYNDYAPYVGMGENLSECHVQLRPKTNIAQLCIGLKDYTDGGGTPVTGVSVIRIIEDGRESYAIGNDGSIATVEAGLACSPSIFVIESVGGSATLTTQDVYNEIKVLLST